MELSTRRSWAPRRPGTLLCLLLGLAAAPASGAGTSAEVGAPAPAFTATDSTGKAVSLAGYRGRFVVLEWTNHDCPFVGKHYGTGNMQALQKEATARGVVWLSVISSAPGRQGHVDGVRADALTRERAAAPSAVLLDPVGSIGKLYGARTTPHMYIVDPSGTLIYKGGIDDTPSASWDDVKGARNYVRAALGEALSGKPVAEPVTRPYGCSVKYAS